MTQESQHNEQPVEKVVMSRKLLNRNRIIEFYIWMFVAAILAVKPIYHIRSYGIEKTLFDVYYELLLALVILLFPFLYKLIFGKLPLESLRHRLGNDAEIKIKGNGNTIIVERESDAISEDLNFHEKLIAESKSISDKIYNRSGAYLLVGCLIAFTGIAIFYSPIFNTTDLKLAGDLSINLLLYAPRFGALFFIEFIAFFFLKQYRIMIEEYKGQEDLIKQIISSCNFHENPITLKKDETTSQLEIEKLTQEDLDVFSKFTELVKGIRK
jgi:hypothetical protein